MKKMKEKLKKKLNEYTTLKNEKPSDLKLPEDFPHCYENVILCETVSSVLFSLKNERHAIIIGEDESGITQIARWCAEYFNKMTNKDKKKEKDKKDKKKEKDEQEKKNENYLCLCTKNLQCSDLIGQTKPCPKNDKFETNEILKFKPGFLVNAIKQGKTVVLDCINEANATVGERLNGLLDKKLDIEKDLIFEIPEFPQKNEVKIKPEATKFEKKKEKDNKKTKVKDDMIESKNDLNSLFGNDTLSLMDNNITDTQSFNFNPTNSFYSPMGSSTSTNFTNNLQAATLGLSVHLHKDKDKHIYKYYLHHHMKEGLAAYYCSDKRCTGSAKYTIDTKNFEIASEHSIPYDKHSYICKPFPNDQRLFREFEKRNYFEAQLFKQANGRSNIFWYN